MDAPEYVRALLDLLGDRNPLEVQAELAAWLEQRTAGLDDVTLRRLEAPGKWSVIEVIQHLADTEMVYGYRIRMILAQDRPPIPGYDQDAWARDFRYRDGPLDDALAQIRALRTRNLRLWLTLDRAQLERQGMHSERGPESVGHTLRLIGAHDLVHRRQIDRILGGAPRR